MTFALDILSFAVLGLFAGFVVLVLAYNRGARLFFGFIAFAAGCAMALSWALQRIFKV